MLGHELVLDQFLRDDGHRLRHIEQRGRRLRRGVDHRHLIATGGGADGDRLAHAGDLEDDFPRGTASGPADRHRLLEKALRNHEKFVVARGERKGEASARIRHGRRPGGLAVGHGGHVCVRNGRLARIENASFKDKSRCGLREGDEAYGRTRRRRAQKIRSQGASGNSQTLPQRPPLPRIGASNASGARANDTVCPTSVRYGPPVFRTGGPDNTRLSLSFDSGA